jgi:hypothetical protein
MSPLIFKLCIVLLGMHYLLVTGGKHKEHINYRMFLQQNLSYFPYIILHKFLGK